MSIEIKNVSKGFGNTQALDKVSLSFGDNRIYGLLGRNGAGKTTLLNIITNRLFADAGEVLLDGIPTVENDKALQKIYMMGEKDYYPLTMKVKDIFDWTKNFYPDFDMEYARKLADTFELNINKNVKSLSTGYNSIFKVIIALSVNTPYVFFDEPVLGLDANHRDVFYRLLLEKYSESPSTIVISTHLIEEVSNVIEDVIIIKMGTIIKNESRESLLSQGFTISGKADSVDSFIINKNVIGIEKIGGLKSAYIMGNINEYTIPADLEVTRLDLQKLFIKLTNA